MRQHIFQTIKAFSVSFIYLFCGFHLSATSKENYLKSIGWDEKVSNPTINKSFASDVEDIRKTDLDQVISDFHMLFGGGFPHSVFVTGASAAANQPLLSAAATILGHTPELGSYLSSVGTSTNDSRNPQFVIFIEKESVEGHEHQLAVFAHEYYHIYQNAPLLDQPETAEPYTWVMEGGAALMETLYVKSTPNQYPYKQENIAELLALCKDYYDQYPSFQFGTEQETHSGINPDGIYNYNLATVAMSYLAHLTNFRQVLWPDWYSRAHEIGFANAFAEHFGMTKTEFYTKFNNFIRNNSKENIEYIAPKTYVLSTLLAEPDLNDDDSDGLSNYDEVVRHGTSKSDDDSDDDGFTDGKEVLLGLNPTGTIANFVNAEYIGDDWRKLDGFGYYYEKLSPWYFHNGMGWFYSPSLEIANFWFYLEDLGWCWFNQSVFPFFFQNASKSWIYFRETDSDLLLYNAGNWTSQK